MAFSITKIRNHTFEATGRARRIWYLEVCTVRSVSNFIHCVVVDLIKSITTNICTNSCGGDKNSRIGIFVILSSNTCFTFLKTFPFFFNICYRNRNIDSCFLDVIWTSYDIRKIVEQDLLHTYQNLCLTWQFRKKGKFSLINTFLLQTTTIFDYRKHIVY